jgi:hypothetical protein
MNDAEFKGYVKRALDENDRHHEQIRGDLKEIKESITKLRLASARGGFIGGSLTAGFAFLIYWAKAWFKQ